MKKYLLMLATVVIATLAMTSCSKEEEDPIVPPQEEEEVPVPQLKTPEFVQSEQINDNPITLSFSWTASEGCGQYDYSLYVDELQIAAGQTAETSVTFASTSEMPLQYDTEYTLKVQAISNDDKVALSSDVVKAICRTAQAPIALSIADLTYRSATFYAVPDDKGMLYQVAQIPVSKYQTYPNDNDFIENYEYGYYKTLTQTPPYMFFGASWTQVMEDLSQKGDYSWKTVILQPETQYIMYAYGCSFDHASTTCNLLTPFIRVFFTTPKWAATSTTKFDISLESNKTKDGYGVVSVKVTPDSDERYMVFFATQDEVQKFGGVLKMCMSRISDYEVGGMVEDYGTSKSLHRGEKTIFNNATGFMPDDDLPSGSQCVAAVCGVDKNGCITTEPVCVEFTVK